MASPRIAVSSAVRTPPSLAAGPAYVSYVLGLLVLVYIVNFVDRSILGILSEPIRRDMGLSDTAIGFLGGFAFAVIYSTAGIPVARWADTGSRKGIIALGLAFWSAMTMACGMVASFWQLVLARVGVGLGEAAASPPAHSLISDYFPPHRRATALAIYATGIPLGTGLGAIVGGWVSEAFDWRTAFMVVGLPGLLLALVVQSTLGEPPRGQFDGAAHAHGEPPESTWDVFAFVWKLRSFRHMSVAAALHSLYAYAAGAGAFGALFFERIHGLSRSEIGSWLGAIAIVFGTLSAFLGGRVGDWLASRGDPRWYFWVPAIATAVGIPFAACQYLCPQPYVSLAFAVPNAILGSMYLGPTFGVTQALVPPRMRATAAALILLIINLIGLGLGPLLTGMLSDALRQAGYEDSIRYALFAVVCGGAAWSSVHYVLGATPLPGDLKAKDRLLARA